MFQSAATFDSIFGPGGKIASILGMLVPILVGLGVVYFVWGLVQFIAKSGDEKGREEGKSRMIWGIIGLFVIVSLWGLVKFVGATLGIDPGGSIKIPQF